MAKTPTLKKTVNSRPAVHGADLAAEIRNAEKLAESLATGVYQQPTPKTVLDEAAAAVNGSRADNYGDQLTNFTNIADRMTITLRDKLVTPITPQDVALLMMDVKMARLAKTNGRHRDSIVDIAGYALCLEKVNEGDWVPPHQGV